MCSLLDISALLLGTSTGSGGHAHLLQLRAYTLSVRQQICTANKLLHSGISILHSAVIFSRICEEPGRCSECPLCETIGWDQQPWYTIDAFIHSYLSVSDEPETRDAWWREVRGEIKAHFRAMGCNAVIGYSEQTSIWWVTACATVHMHSCKGQIHEAK